MLDQRVMKFSYKTGFSINGVNTIKSIKIPDLQPQRCLSILRWILGYVIIILHPVNPTLIQYSRGESI